MSGRRQSKGKGKASAHARLVTPSDWSQPLFAALDLCDSLFQDTPYPSMPPQGVVYPDAGISVDPSIAPRIPTGEATHTDQGFDATRSEDIDVDIVGASGSGVHDVKKIFIAPRGDEFTAQTVCARSISKIISQKFNGPWRSYKAAPIEVRDLWFNEFKLAFTWKERVSFEIRRIFDHVGSNVLKNRLYDAKKSSQRPGWITPNIWAALQQEWEQQPYKKVCDRNKKNRASNCDGRGFPMHVGGSLSHKTHIDMLREKQGREPTISEGFMYTHSRMNAQGERVWVDERSRRTHEKFIEQFENSSDGASNTTPTPVSTQMERWREVAGASKKGRVYGFGGLTKSNSTHSTGFRNIAKERELEAEVRGLKDELEQMREEIADVAQLRAQVADMDKLRAQVALLTSTMMAQQPTTIPFPTVRRTRMAPTPPVGSSGLPARGSQVFVSTPAYSQRSNVDSDDTQSDDDGSDS